MVYAKFVHSETRPVDGIPDPHYHIHVFAMNATFDEVEKEWKALEVGNTVGDHTFYEAHFHHLLAAKVEASVAQPVIPSIHPSIHRSTNHPGLLLLRPPFFASSVRSLTVRSAA
jgi:hypothetical protein